MLTVLPKEALRIVQDYVQRVQANRVWREPMSTTEQPAVGTIVHFDLTVDDAPSIRDFYTSVVGWGIEEMDMGDYRDYVLTSPTTGAWAGGSAMRGASTPTSSQWLMYVQVADLEASLQRCVDGGGTLVTEIRASRATSTA